jgi:hypothetical protein
LAIMTTSRPTEVLGKLNRDMLSHSKFITCLVECPNYPKDKYVDTIS